MGSASGYLHSIAILTVEQEINFFNFHINMQKLLIVSLFTVFATKSLGQNSTIEDFFKTASTISDRFDTTNSTFRIRRIEVTPNSLSIDGKEMIQPSFQDFHLADSLIDKVFNLQLGDVIRFEKGTDIEYFKALKVDTK